MRICKTCEVPQEDSHFAIKRNGKVNQSCQTCVGKAKTYYQQNREKRLTYQKERYKNDPAARAADRELQAKWNAENKGYTGDYFRTRRKTDALFDARVKASGQLFYAALKSKKPDKYIPEIGCTAAELRRHIEAQFQPGMTWENHGRGSWGFDHIFPLAIAMRVGEEVLRKALNYRNVRPVWEKDNYAKSLNLPPEYPTVEAFIEAAKDW